MLGIEKQKVNNDLSSVHFIMFVNEICWQQFDNCIEYIDEGRGTNSQSEYIQLGLRKSAKGVRMSYVYCLTYYATPKNKCPSEKWKPDF